MKVYENKDYMDDVAFVAKIDLPWEKLQNKSILLSGATGLLGSFFVDVIMYRNRYMNMNTTVHALSRNEKKAKERFAYCLYDENFKYHCVDINGPFEVDEKKIDYVIHLASNTHPVAYATDPIGTITTNLFGTKNLLDFAKAHDAERALFASSNEIYGENRGDVEKFEESYCGYIDSNTLRAGYPESKRCGEALCQAYISQKDMDIVIARFTRSYGPTLLEDDTKALSQFLGKAVKGEDIVLKSAGTQFFSYTYVADAISGMLTVLLLGERGEAYNISDEASDVMLKDLAAIIADFVGKKVIFELPNKVESAGFSKATKARLDNHKIQKLGWKARYDIKLGIMRTIQMMKALVAD